MNLFLQITARRADGYHLLDSLAVFANVGDWISARQAATLSLQISGPFGAGLAATEDNLVLRAARLLAAPAGAALMLQKNLPVASGIGGGSADAAATLRLLARLWGVRADLSSLAPRLGADVPVCIASLPARMGGIGEIIQPAPSLPAFGLLLVNPGVAVSTAKIFQAWTGAFSPVASLPAGWRHAKEMAVTLRGLTNDLEAPACLAQPVIADVLATLNALPGALLARMSGSGATCFAIFESPQAASRAAARIVHPSWWLWSGGLYEPAAADI